MKHFTSPRFWRHYGRLQPEIQKLADKNFAVLKDDPRHKSLQLKKVGEFWSVRVGIDYRAVAKERADGLVWFWIGKHDDYMDVIA